MLSSSGVCGLHAVNLVLRARWSNIKVDAHPKAIGSDGDSLISSKANTRQFFLSEYKKMVFLSEYVKLASILCDISALTTSHSLPTLPSSHHEDFLVIRPSCFALAGWQRNALPQRTTRSSCSNR